MSMAAKKEGMDMPNDEARMAVRSKIPSFLSAAMMPVAVPRMKASAREDRASMKVLGRACTKMEPTLLPL